MALMAHKDLREILDRKDRKDLPDHKDYPVPMVLMEQMV